MKSVRALLLGLALSAASFRAAGGTVPVSLFIVSDTNGLSRSVSDVTNMLAEVNRLYRQAAVVFHPVRFEIIPSNEWAHVERDATGERPLIGEICDYARNTGGFECYFVRSIVGANGVNSEEGLVLDSGADSRTWAHELGHAFGFYDIYDQYDGAPFNVTGGVARAGMVHDWGSASDEGFYPSGLQQADLVKRLLMYGYSSPVKADIPYGDVTGLWYESVWDSTNHVWLKDWHLSPAYVGFFLHYNPYPHHR